MIRGMAAVIALLAATGCSSGTAGPIKDSSPTTFTGAWRSVTPSYEFVGLTISPKQSEAGVLATRLTFSGIALDGPGRIVGDSVIAELGMSGTAKSGSVLVAYRSDARTLRASLRRTGVTELEFTFVRDD